MGAVSRRTSNRRAVLIVVGAPAVAAAGCALLVGQPDGHVLFEVADAAGTPADESLDGTVPPDAAKATTTAESGALAPDAPVVDATDGGGPAPDSSAVDAADAGGQAPDGSAVDAANGGGPDIRCTRQYCSAPGSVCCVSNPENPVDGGACLSEQQCFAPALAFFCSSQADCAAQGLPGDYCCAPMENITYGGQNALELAGAQCSSTCIRANNAILCDPGHPAECAALDAGCSALIGLANAIYPAGYYGCQ